MLKLLDKKIENSWLPRLNQSKVNLESVTAGLKSVQYNKELASINLIRKQAVHEISKTDLTSYSAKVQSAYANILKPVADSEMLASLILAFGVVGAAFKGLGILGKKQQLKGLKKKVIPGM